MKQIFVSIGEHHSFDKIIQYLLAYVFSNGRTQSFLQSGIVFGIRYIYKPYTNVLTLSFIPTTDIYQFCQYLNVAFIEYISYLISCIHDSPGRILIIGSSPPSTSSNFLLS